MLAASTGCAFPFPVVRHRHPVSSLFVAVHDRVAGGAGLAIAHCDGDGHVSTPNLMILFPPPFGTSPCWIKALSVLRTYKNGHR